MTRTSTSTRWPPPTRSNTCSCRARTILPWVSSGMSATSSSSSVPPWACSKVPILRPGPSTPASVPNSSISSRSGRMVAQFSPTNGPPARRERAWIRRATTSLPAPAGPEISTRLPVGATLSIDWRTWLTAEDRPINSASPPARSFSSWFSRFSRAASMARSTISRRRSALNGFSMKS